VQRGGRLDAEAGGPHPGAKRRTVSDANGCARAEYDVSSKPVERQHQQERGDGKRRQEPDHSRQSRQAEDVEADVPGENRIVDPERRAVNGSENEIPGRSRRKARQQCYRE
jgi:hypothetical protein